jgi:lysyl-tRNA synthetase class 2
MVDQALSCSNSLEGNLAMAQAWEAKSIALRMNFLIARGHMVTAMRSFFANRDFIEVETPSLQVSPGMEPHLKAFSTRLEEPFADSERELYLHTSPEFAMKKLLAGGLPRIFQLAKVFRNGERAPTHHPEFSMLEWYRAEEPYLSLIEDCRELLQESLLAAGGELFRRAGRTSDPFQPWQKLTVSEAFAKYCQIDILRWLEDANGLAEEAKKLGLAPDPNDSWDDIFFRIFLEHIEPHLGHPVPTIVYGYPLSMAALARRSPDDPRLAERFELYVCGLELANAFGELADPVEQRSRFTADMELKERLYGIRYPIDEDFLAALAQMPEASGIALGFDRLVMLAVGAEKIEDVLWLPVQ